MVPTGPQLVLNWYPVGLQLVFNWYWVLAVLHNPVFSIYLNLVQLNQAILSEQGSKTGKDPINKLNLDIPNR